MRQNIRIADLQLVVRERPVLLRAARVVVFDKCDGAVGRPPEQPWRPAARIAKAAVLRTLGCLVEDAFGGKVKCGRHAATLVDPVHQALPAVVLWARFNRGRRRAASAGDVFNRGRRRTASAGDAFNQGRRRAASAGDVFNRGRRRAASAGDAGRQQAVFAGGVLAADAARFAYVCVNECPAPASAYNCLRALHIKCGALIHCQGGCSARVHDSVHALRCFH
eukprot:363754-Chlamydomonas_euryale.AAC.2